MKKTFTLILVINLINLLSLENLTGFAQGFAQTPKPKVYLVATAHFDTQWNWDVQRSIADYVPKTMRQNLLLLEKYPDYIFNFEGGIKYAWMKEYYPYEYELVKRQIAAGRWHITGSTWDANDANIPSTESTTRNILYGQHFYRDEFDVQGTDIFLPDCFGFTYTLPSIAAHAGLIGFSTQKLQWRQRPFYSNGKKIPFEIGLWEGVDGQRIMLVADGRSYVTRWNDEDLSQNADLLQQAKNNPLNILYHYYGTGDTGGAPTIESVRALEKGVAGNGAVKIISATSDRIYKDFLPFDKHPELPVFKGELLMDVHATGCYTSQAAMKLFNRRNETLADAAERAAVAADFLGAVKYPQNTLTEAWKRFIWHQFHDEITGTSIPRAYEISWNDELISLKQFSNVLETSVGAVARALNTQAKGMPLVLYNPLAAAISEVVEIEIAAKPAEHFIIYDENGKALPTQAGKYENGKRTLLVAANLPSCGYVAYDVRPQSSLRATTRNPQIKEGIPAFAGMTESQIENSVYKIVLDKNGDISSIFDKRNNREIVENGKSIRLALFTENESFAWPAWEILKKTVDAAPISISENVKISIAEQGAVRNSLCVERTFGKSVFKQYIRLNEGGQADRIDIVNEIEWQTTNALLKAEFPLNISNPNATYDLGLGSVKRGNNTDIAYEVFAQQWADLTDTKGDYGVSILNDCKYGWDKPADNTLRLTLLHTPKTQGNFTYQSEQDFGKHRFTYSIVGHKDDYVSAETVHKAEILNEPPQAFIAEKHAGTLGKSFSFIKNDNKNVSVKAVKKAEKSDEYIIRLYETSGRDAVNRVSTTLTFPSQIIDAKEVNGIEDEIGAANFAGNSLKIEMKPFGIKTFKIKLQNPNLKLETLNFKPLTLPYDTKAATYNAFRNVANFDGKGNSFAAELFPQTLDFKGVKFEFAGADEPNALRCRGQAIDLPQGDFNRIYLLAASIEGDTRVAFTVKPLNPLKGTSPHQWTEQHPLGRGVEYNILIPSYTGFAGQWGHTGHTEGFLKTADIAFVGTHRHSMSENRDLPYEFSYIFAFAIDIPKGAKQLILPENQKIALFAATLINDENNALIPATDLLRVNLPDIESANAAETLVKNNMLFGKSIIEKTGEVNSREKAEFATDEDLNTKWCDTSGNNPKYIVVDLGEERTLRGWSVFHAGLEDAEFVTREFSLQTKQNAADEWQTADTVTDNKLLETDRALPQEIKARYVRLNIIKGEQNYNNIARIYDFRVW
ncbi:MAG: discoidin domain-containing protein [Paludibacter sp.]|jgi:alpha-mannosidase|nr:discoidin domain-containing protein [Paludibacter sp.]